MYAVIKTGGKQYRVTDGDKLRVEKLAVEIDSELILDQVLAVGNGENIRVGAPIRRVGNSKNFGAWAVR